MSLVLDYSAGFPGAQRIKDAGYQGAVRYIGFPGRTKCTTKSEFEDFKRVGIFMALVFEDSATAWRRGFSGGQTDARTAVADADRIGWPSDRPIYFAVDQQVLTNAELNTAREYVRGAASVLGFSRTGVYGQYSVIEACRDTCQYFWQCRAWSGTPPKLSAIRDLYQHVGTVTVGGIACDTNEVLSSDWGQHTQQGDDKLATSQNEFNQLMDGYLDSKTDTIQGQSMNLKTATFKAAQWSGDAFNTGKSVLAAVAALPPAASLSDADVALLGDRINAHLGGAYNVTITPA